ncbi:hypothetical protein BKA62DRAFT_685544 [Auriculariales sp. MPI-PUGE-AT-0066]|nr:hypothetical protein BKA62DRAFT_685544 [Auriculariales sp. MPI-PUGE-AT-0066]
MDEDVFESVDWDNAHINAATASAYSVGPPMDPLPEYEAATGPGYRQSVLDDAHDERGPHDPKWEGYLITTVRDPVKELPETKDTYVSYLVTAQTNLPTFTAPNPTARRRFQDFVFLRENLAKDFPACVVPPLPDKHRMGPALVTPLLPKLTHSCRLSRHPTLQRATLVRAFFESTEWQVHMHQHLAHPPSQEPPTSLLENLSDTLLNAFSRVRKPDERFLSMREAVDKTEEGINSIDRLTSRVRTRTSDLSADYKELAIAVQGLGFLESGITDPLNHFSNTLLEFSALLRHSIDSDIDPFLLQLHSLLAYLQSNRQVLKLRDQKQLDFEELSEYLNGVTMERNRLAAVISGHATSSGQGIGAYLRDRVDALRGADDDRTRVERMKKLDSRIKELEEAVSVAHETSDAFSEETLREQMKDMFTQLADGQIEMYKASMQEWERIIPILQRIRVDV